MQLDTMRYLSRWQVPVTVAVHGLSRGAAQAKHRMDHPAEMSSGVTSLHVANSTAWQSASVQYNVYATNSYRY
jgi:hypothetical protein